MTCLSFRVSRLRDADGEITVNFREELEKWSLESKYCAYYRYCNAFDILYNFFFLMAYGPQAILQTFEMG